jgi:PBP1b-binding outer membrane lipoprotein LpoB
MKTTFVMLMGTLLLVACSEGSPVEVTPTYDQATLDMKYQAVYDLIQDTACSDTSNCASVGIGSKPCGGCQRWVVYSTATVDVDELTTLVIDLALYEKGYNQQEGFIGDCGVAQPAQPECVNQKCVDLN